MSRTSVPENQNSTYFILRSAKFYFIFFSVVFYRLNKTSARHFHHFQVRGNLSAIECHMHLEAMTKSATTPLYARDVIVQQYWLLNSCVKHSSATLKEKFGAMIYAFPRIDFRKSSSQEREPGYEVGLPSVGSCICHTAKQRLNGAESQPPRLTFPSSLYFGDLSRNPNG